MHHIYVAVAKHYVENLRDEVKKGMREKAEQGIFPGHAPFGYRNHKRTRAIDVDSVESRAVRRNRIYVPESVMTEILETLHRESGRSAEGATRARRGSGAKPGGSWYTDQSAR